MDCRECPFKQEHQSAVGWQECSLTGGEVPRQDGREDLICPLALPLGPRTNCGRHEARKVCAGTLRIVADREMLGELLAAYPEEDAAKLRGIAIAEGIPLPD